MINICGLKTSVVFLETLEIGVNANLSTSFLKRLSEFSTCEMLNNYDGYAFVNREEVMYRRKYYICK